METVETIETVLAATRLASDGLINAITEHFTLNLLDQRGRFSVFGLVREPTAFRYFIALRMDKPPV